MNEPSTAIPLSPLTEREFDILSRLASGRSDREIAEEFFLTVGTVKWYNRQIYSKLAVRNRTEAAARAKQLGLLGNAPHSPAGTGEKRPRHNLPAQVTSFVGRSHELKQLKQLLLESRLVTLTGPPGTGKTRLALEVTGSMLDEFRDGVYFVSLASLGQPELVASSVAQALGIMESGSEPLRAVLQGQLGNKHLLLVLDNFEHLLPAAVLLSELLANAPHLTILATSRERLRLYGEHEFPVLPMQLPDLKQSLTTDRIKPYEAVELFVQRTQAAHPAFVLDDSNASAIATICAHLDGLPLAIELAAARIKYYAPQTLLLRLSSRLEALGGGPRDRPLRQRTLRATLAWSYDLLTEAEQVLFTRLGAFADGWTLADAEAVCGDDSNLSIASGLESLLNKNLLRLEQRTHDQPRFVMLGTMREFALDKLAERGETVFMSEQHARYFLMMATRATQESYGANQAHWLMWLEAQHDNLRAALQWSLSTTDTDQICLAFIGNLARFWELRGHFSEARTWLSRALNSPGTDAWTNVRADAIFGVALLILRQGDHATAQAFCEEALAIYQELGEQRRAALTLVRLSEIASVVGDFSGAAALSRKAYTIARDLDAEVVIGNVLCQLGFDALRFEDFDQARVRLEDGLASYEEADDHVGIALACSGLGELAVRQGELDTATTWLEKSLGLRQELGDRLGIAASLGSLAWVALRRNDLGHAATILRESLIIRQDIEEQGGIAWCLEKLAEIAQLNRDAVGAVRILGVAATIRARGGSVIDPADQPRYRRMIERLRDELGPDIFEAVWSEGQMMSLEQIIQYTFSETPF